LIAFGLGFKAAISVQAQIPHKGRFVKKEQANEISNKVKLCQIPDGLNSLFIPKFFPIPVEKRRPHVFVEAFL